MDSGATAYAQQVPTTFDFRAYYFDNSASTSQRHRVFKRIGATATNSYLLHALRGDDDGSAYPAGRRHNGPWLHAAVTAVLQYVHQHAGWWRICRDQYLREFSGAVGRRRR